MTKRTLHAQLTSDQKMLEKMAPLIINFLTFFDTSKDEGDEAFTPFSHSPLLKLVLAHFSQQYL
jgi:hypothetical protein